ncbi:MAG: hypothetical protein IKE30_01215 [Clostridia bacterium]|nr:hypothetical protein [Clostridia bacterium]
MKKCLIFLLITALLAGGAALAEEVAARPGEMNRAILYGLIRETEDDLTRTISPAECMTMLGNAIFELGGNVGIWDALAGRADSSGSLTRLQYCLMLERAGATIGIAPTDPFTSADTVAYTNVSDDSPLFGVTPGNYTDANGESYPSEWAYAIAYASHTRSIASGQQLAAFSVSDPESLKNSLSWQEAVAGAVRLYEAKAEVGAVEDEPEAEVPEEIPAVQQASRWPTAPVDGAYGYTIVVTADNVNIREEADDNGKVIDHARRGMRLWCDGGISDWYRIRDNEGTAAFISTKYAVEETQETMNTIAAPDDTAADTPAEAPDNAVLTDTEPVEGITPVSVPYTVMVTADNVNLRSKPSTDGKPAGKATLGTRYLCIGESEGWYQVSNNAGGSYFISSEFCARDTDASFVAAYPKVRGILRVTAATMSIRATASAKGAVVKKAEKGELYGFVEKVSDNWYRILYCGDAVGFINASGVAEASNG